MVTVLSDENHGAKWGGMGNMKSFIVVMLLVGFVLLAECTAAKAAGTDERSSELRGGVPVEVRDLDVQKLRKPDDLYIWSKEYEKHDGQGDKNRFEAGMFIGYVSGVYAIGNGRESYAPFCVPFDSKGQIYNIVAKFLREHPEEWSGAEGLVRSALAETFPCEVPLFTERAKEFAGSKISNVSSKMLDPDGAFTLYVNSQSHKIDPVDVQVEIDGELVISDDFSHDECGIGGHCFRPFKLSLPKGRHRIHVWSKKGATEMMRKFDIQDHDVGVVIYWYHPAHHGQATYRKFEFTTQKGPLQIANRGTGAAMSRSFYFRT
jgi:Rap1a immunity proteins